MTAPLALGADDSRRDQMQLCASIVTHYEDWSFAARVAAEARGRGLELLALHAEQQVESSRNLFGMAKLHVVGLAAGIRAEELYEHARRFLAAGGIR